MPAPRGTSAARHDCIVSQSKAPVNTLFAEAAAFFARLSPLCVRPPRPASDAAGRTAAAHPPRIVGRIPQRARGIRRGKPSRMLFTPIFPKFPQPKDDAAGRKIAPKRQGSMSKSPFPIPATRASDAAARNLRRPYALPHCLTAQSARPYESQKPAASALIRRTDT